MWLKKFSCWWCLKLHFFLNHGRKKGLRHCWTATDRQQISKGYFFNSTRPTFNVVCCFKFGSNKWWACLFTPAGSRQDAFIPHPSVVQNIRQSDVSVLLNSRGGEGSIHRLGRKTKMRHYLSFHEPRSYDLLFLNGEQMTSLSIRLVVVFFQIHRRQQASAAWTGAKSSLVSQRLDEVPLISSVCFPLEAIINWLDSDCVGPKLSTFSSLGGSHALKSRLDFAKTLRICERLCLQPWETPARNQAHFQGRSQRLNVTWTPENFCAYRGISRITQRIRITAYNKERSVSE